jgi:hypothetical protein
VHPKDESAKCGKNAVWMAVNLDQWKKKMFYVRTNSRQFAGLSVFASKKMHEAKKI